MSVTKRRFCGCMGCREPAAKIVLVDDRQRAVCPTHAKGQEVLVDV